MKIPLTRLAILLAAAAVAWAPARADVYRCVVPDGNTLYSDAPCPRGATHGSNITTVVGACSTVECTAQREQAAAVARQRLRADQDQLAIFADKRRRDEIEAARERARFDELLWRQSVEARLAATANESGYTASSPLFYPIFPVHLAVRPCGWRCPKLLARSHNAASGERRHGVPIRLDRR